MIVTVVNTAPHIDITGLTQEEAGYLLKLLDNAGSPYPISRGYEVLMGLRKALLAQGVQPLGATEGVVYFK